MQDGHTTRLPRDQVKAHIFLARHRATIVVLEGDQAGQEYEIGVDGLSVGRGPGVDVAIADSSMSKAHAAFEAGGEGVRVRDMGSTNGTTVNGSRVNAADLKHGDRVGIAEIDHVDRPLGQPPGFRLAYRVYFARGGDRFKRIDQRHCEHVQVPCQPLPGQQVLGKRDRANRLRVRRGSYRAQCKARTFRECACSLPSWSAHTRDREATRDRWARCRGRRR